MPERDIKIERMDGNPIIRPYMERRMGGNINGPSLIQTPEWLAGRLGRYHLYFAHHLGSYIRLAYADDLSGPWQIHAPGVLDLAQTPMLYEHIASPDVHVDKDRRELRMYFHGISAPDPVLEPVQSSCVAHSFDGITFAARPELLGASYFRVWQWQNTYYAISLGGIVWRSNDGITPFQEGSHIEGLPPKARHFAVQQKGARLWLAWSVTGEAPERLYLGWLDLNTPWEAWCVEGVRELLRPEHDWEFAELPQTQSEPGLAWHPVNQLRDPAFFREDGIDYLLYSVGGESGIAIARIEGLEAT